MVFFPRKDATAICYTVMVVASQGGESLVKGLVATMNKPKSVCVCVCVKFFALSVTWADRVVCG